MTKDEYTKRLEEILQELSNYVYNAGTAAKNYGIFIGGEPMKDAITAIQQLNNEAIGADSYWYVDDDGVKQYNTFNGTANGVKRELRAVIGQDND